MGLLSVENQMAKKTKRSGKAAVTAKAKKSTGAISKRRTTIKTKRVPKLDFLRRVAEAPRHRALTVEAPIAAATRSEPQPSLSPIMFWPGLPLAMISMWMAPVRAAFGR